MTPWDIINKIFKGEIINTDEEDISFLLINRILSFDKEFLFHECQDLNYFYSLTSEEWYYLFLVCFSGRNRYIKYRKKDKLVTSKLIDEFQDRVKQYYKWSNREFEMGYKILIGHKKFPEFLEELGFSDSDREKILKYVGK